MDKMCTRALARVTSRSLVCEALLVSTPKGAPAHMATPGPSSSPPAPKGHSVSLHGVARSHTRKRAPVRWVTLRVPRRRRALPSTGAVSPARRQSRAASVPRGVSPARRQPRAPSVPRAVSPARRQSRAPSAPRAVSPARRQPRAPSAPRAVSPARRQSRAPPSRASGIACPERLPNLAKGAFAR
jgi:hypothetical protein